MIFKLILLAAGFILLIKGADWFVDGASDMASSFGIPQLVIGLTIVAMGTSMPEAAVSIAAALKGTSEIAVGNVVGSNILNILLILGITSIIAAVPVQKSTLKFEIPFMIAITVIMLFMCLSGREVSFLEGIILWILFLSYLAYLYFLSVKDNKDKQQDIVHKKCSIWSCIARGAVGCILIIAGSNMAVEGASGLAGLMGMSERLIGLTIVAFGTSLPELVTSVTAARKGNSAIAVGNIIGSNIFNILFIIGSTALITPVKFDSGFTYDVIIAALSGALLWILLAKNKKLGRICGIIMLSAYILYSVYLYAV